MKIVTKQNLKDFVTSILGDVVLDDTLFDQLADIAQERIDGFRPWNVLKSEDSTQAVAVGNTYTTQKSMPADFNKWDDDAVQLVDSSGNETYLSEVSKNQKFRYKDDGNKFYCNYATKKIYICGTQTVASTIYQFYIKDSARVSDDADGDTLSWEFPARYNAIIGYFIAVYHKLGIDYDIINNAQGDNNAAIANGILNDMAEWDTELSLGQLDGKDPFGSNGYRSGRISQSNG